MMDAPNSLNLNCKVRVMKEAPDPSVSEEIADIFTNYDIDTRTQLLVVCNIFHDKIDFFLKVRLSKIAKNVSTII